MFAAVVGFENKQYPKENSSNILTAHYELFPYFQIYYGLKTYQAALPAYVAKPDRLQKLVWGKHQTNRDLTYYLKENRA